MSADINIGAITESLNNKVDLPTGDSQDGIDFVVDWQNPTAENNYTWYRKYKSGWVEQGGSSPTEGTTLFEFPVVMADNRYTVLALGGGHTGSGADIAIYVYNKTTTSVEFVRDRSTYLQWQVSGMSAQ